MAINNQNDANFKATEHHEKDTNAWFGHATTVLDHEKAEMSVPIPAGADIKVVVFDVGKVLVPFYWPFVVYSLARFYGCSNGQVHTVLKKLDKEAGYEDGKCSTEEFVDMLNQELEPIFGQHLSKREFTRLWNQTFHKDKRMSKLLRVLKSKYPIFVMSNANPDHVIQLRKQGVYKHFEESHLIFSYAEGVQCSKPESGIYLALLQRLKDLGIDVRPDQILFVDDRWDCLLTAHLMGWRVLNLDPDDPRAAARTIAEFERIGLIPQGSV